MDTNRQTESDEAKLRERLGEFLRRARDLETVTQAPANLPRVKEVSRPPLPVHESFLPGSILTTLFRNPKTGRTVTFKGEELTELDGMSSASSMMKPESWPIRSRSARRRSRRSSSVYFE